MPRYAKGITGHGRLYDNRNNRKSRIAVVVLHCERASEANHGVNQYLVKDKAYRAVVQSR